MSDDPAHVERDPEDRAIDPRDADAWNQVLDAHYELGLTGPARELQRRAPFAAPRAAREPPPNAGRRSWRGLQPRFEANLAALPARDARARRLAIATGVLMILLAVPAVQIWVGIAQGIAGLGLLFVLFGPEVQR